MISVVLKLDTKKGTPPWMPFISSTSSLRKRLQVKNYISCYFQPPPSALYRPTIALICFCLVSISSVFASKASR